MASGPISYTTVDGFFLQSLDETDDDNFDYATTNLGLIPQAYPTEAGADASSRPAWVRFEAHIAALNRAAPPHISYRVLLLARHGQGYHNAGLELYGPREWDEHWAHLDGDGTLSWADARLTEVGLAEARRAAEFLACAMLRAGMPAPERYYVSPLTRSMQTAERTWACLNLPPGRPFVPTIKEGLREDVSLQTSERRSSRAAIAAMYPGWEFESGFAEEDPLWTGDDEETDDECIGRAQRTLDDIFRTDDSTWISITSHSGEISALLDVLDHRPFHLRTGQIMPLVARVVRADRDGEMVE